MRFIEDRNLPGAVHLFRARLHGPTGWNSRPVTYPLLLDEMFTSVIAQRLGERGHDVAAVVTDQALLGLSDEQILAAAAAGGRLWSPPISKTSHLSTPPTRPPDATTPAWSWSPPRPFPKTDPSSVPSWKPSPPCLPNQTCSCLTE